MAPDPVDEPVDIDLLDADDPDLPEARRRAPTNGDLARIFHEMGDILEVKGEIKFKTVAYHRAADAIARAPFDVASTYAAGDRRPIPGVGQAIGDKIVELATTGHMAAHERLRAEIPASLVDLLRIPGVGPQTVRVVYEGLGIETLEDLRQAAEAGRLRGLKGISASTEQRILEGIEQLESRPQRLLLNRAQAISDDLVAQLEGTPGVRRIVQAGSLRRRRETIGDLDLLVETDDPDAVVARFTGLGVVERVLGAGHAKAAAKLLRGPQVDLMVMPPGEAGTYLVHFTGSADHNIALRGIARDRGWSLSEKGFIRIDEDGQALEGEAADLRTFPDEAAAYAFLDLAFIEPELREDRGEIEAAREGRLPALITRADLRGDLHTHSEWSDGVHPIEVMAEACRRLGYAYQVLTDHSQSLGIAHGLEPERVEQERGIIAGLNARFAAEEAAGIAPAGANPGGFRLLHGCELEVRADGNLDYDDDLLVPVRPRGRVGPRGPTPAAGRAHAAHAQRDPQPARGRHRPPLGPDDPDPRRPRPRLGRRVRGGRRDRHRARDQRLAAPPRPRRRARAPRGLDGLPPHDRLRRPPDRGARVRALGRRPGAPGVGGAGERAQHPPARGPARLGRGKAGPGLTYHPRR